MDYLDAPSSQYCKPHRSFSLGDMSPALVDRVPSTGVEDVDPWTAWAYRPRGTSALLAGAALLVYGSGALQPEPLEGDTADHIKRGVWAMIAVYLGYSLLQAPNTILIRPHPAVWRFVHGIAVVYLVFLTFMLFQTADDARQFLKHLHSGLGIEQSERSYGTDCRIYTPEIPTNNFKNVYDTVFDEFVIAHTLGWYCKAIMYRNNMLLWIISLGFEVMEVMFRHMLPNFSECWWDSIILDVFICNWLGIWLGMQTVQYFDGKTYEWLGVSKQPTLIGKLHRSLLQFTPATWDKDQWNMLSGPKRFVQVLGLIVLSLVVELNAFFLKYCLWMPPTNPLNTYRLIIWFLLANPAIREFNQFLQDSQPMKKLGPYCWIAVAICIVETLISIKFGQGMYPDPMPTSTFWIWIMSIFGLVIFLAVWVVRECIKKQKILHQMNGKKQH